MCHILILFSTVTPSYEKRTLQSILKDIFYKRWKEFSKTQTVDLTAGGKNNIHGCLSCFNWKRGLRAWRLVSLVRVFCRRVLGGG